jgi:hypothetical protein
VQGEALIFQQAIPNRKRPPNAVGVPVGRPPINDRIASIRFDTLRLATTFSILIDDHHPGSTRLQRRRDHGGPHPAPSVLWLVNDDGPADRCRAYRDQALQFRAAELLRAFARR